MGLDYAEAARALDIPLNTFKSHLLRGTKQLREALAAELEAPAGGTGQATAGSAGWPALGSTSTMPERTTVRMVDIRASYGRPPNGRLRSEPPVAEQLPD